MDPHPLANLFKRSNYDEPISSEFCALDYLYKALLEIHESEKYDELLYEAIHDRSLNRKHDCNDFTINSLDVNSANNMQNPKLGDASFAMTTIFCNDHDWGDSSFDLENLFKPHDEYEIDNSVCNIESGFGRASTLDPTYLENVQSYEIYDKSVFGEVITLVNVNPTILEECQLCMHVDHEENILCDSYIVEFDYDPTCNYYEGGKYGCGNFYVTKLLLVMLRFSMFYSYPLHMLDISCLDNLFAYEIPMHRKYVRLKYVCHMFCDALFVLQFLSFNVSIIKIINA